MKKRLLITGFDPFGGSNVNPSWMAVEMLPAQIGNYTLCKLPIPTIFGKAAKLVLEKANEFQPDLILCVGLACGRDAITPERIAVNIRDARIPDNEGNRPLGERVVEEGPAAYFSTVPVEKMAQAIRHAQIPAVVSNTAGTFVCNDVLYSLLHHYAGTAVRVGFIHVPNIPESGSPSLLIEQIVSALTAAITACN